MKESMQENFDGLKNDIAELKAKDDYQIITMIQKENELREEVKAKD